MINKIENLKELKNLSEINRAKILKEYDKGYHFLLIWGNLISVIFLSSVAYLLLSYLKDLPLWKASIILMLIIYIIVKLIEILKVNIIDQKVVRDLIKDLEKNKIND